MGFCYHYTCHQFYCGVPLYSEISFFFLVFSSNFIIFNTNIFGDMDNKMERA